MWLVRNNDLLQVIIRAVLQCTGSSSLQPEVLQQAGLQLLQALAAPLQQLQLCSPQDQLPGLVDVGGRIAEQLFALHAAAAGMFELMPSTTGEPCAAAAAVGMGCILYEHHGCVCYCGFPNAGSLLKQCPTSQLRHQRMPFEMH
jgi:hypothetical protein